MDTTPLPQQPEITNVGNTLTNGINGQYNFHLGAILKEAWGKTYGIKATYWKAFGLIFLILVGLLVSFIAISFCIGLTAGLLDASKSGIDSLASVLSIIFTLAYVFPMAPLLAGLIMIAIKHCIGESVAAKSIFQYYAYWKKLWVYPFILVGIDFLAEAASSYNLLIVSIILTIIYIYVAVGCVMFSPLIVEKQLSVWDALKASHKAISHHWFKMLWFVIVITLILFCSLLTLGIALIWTMPMVNNAVGILYREMFGVSKTTTATIGNVPINTQPPPNTITKEV